MKKRSRDRRYTFFFWGSVVSFFFTALAIFLLHPASYLALNRGSNLLQNVVSLMFWISLVFGLVFQLICLILRKKTAPEFPQKYRKRRSERKHGKRTAGVLFKNPLAIIMLLIFLAGLAGSIVCMSKSMMSSYQTFTFIALTVLGLLGYLVFNSINYEYIKHRRKGNET